MSFTIVTDAALDLPEAYADRDDVFIVPTFVMLDDIEYKDYELPVDKLLEEMKQGKFSTTSQPSPDLFRDAYGKAVEVGQPILGIHLSSELSGTMNGAFGMSQLFEDADIELFDSHNVSFGGGYFVQMALQLKDRGYSRDQVIEVLYWARPRTHIEVLVQDIEYLKAGGRVNLGKYWLLKLLHLKPILENEQGKINRVGFTFPFSDMVEKLVNRVRNFDDYGTSRFLGIGHVNTPDILEQLEEYASEIEHEELIKIRITATLLSHTGPRVFGMMVAPALSSLETQLSKAD